MSENGAITVEATTAAVGGAAARAAADDDWKQELLEKLHKAINNAVTLEIVTAVGFTKGNPLDLDMDREPVVALSKINLLLGDIKTIYPEEFVTGPYQPLRDFHAEREQQGHAIIQKNIEALKALYKFALNPGQDE